MPKVPGPGDITRADLTGLRVKATKVPESLLTGTGAGLEEAGRVIGRIAADERRKEEEAKQKAQDIRDANFVSERTLGYFEEMDKAIEAFETGPVDHVATEALQTSLDAGIERALRLEDDAEPVSDEAMALARRRLGDTRVRFGATVRGIRAKRQIAEAKQRREAPLNVALAQVREDPTFLPDALVAGRNAIGAYDRVFTGPEQKDVRDAFTRAAVREAVAGYLDLGMVEEAGEIAHDQKFRAVLGPDDRAAMNNAIVAARKQRAARLEQEMVGLRAALRKHMTDDLASRQATGTGAGVSEADIRAAFKPDEAAEFFAAQARADRLYADSQELLIASPIRARQILEARRPAGEGFTAENEDFQALVETFRRRDEAMITDPAAYVLQNSDRISTAATLAQENPAEPAFLDIAITLSLAEQTRLGVPRHIQRVLTNNEIGVLVGRFKDVNVQDRLGLIDGLQARYRENWPRVYGELVKAGLPAGTAVLASMSSPTQGRARTDLAEAQEAGRKELAQAIGTEAEKEIDAAVEREMQPLRETLLRVPGGLETSGQFRDAVRLLAYRYSQQGMNAHDAARHAAADIVLGNYFFEGTYRIPFGFTVDHVRTGIERMTDGLGGFNIDAPPSVDARLSEEARREQYVRQIQAKGFWVTNGDETGVMLMDEQGRTVTVDGGVPLEVGFDTLQRAGGVEEIMAGELHDIPDEEQAREIVEQMKRDINRRLGLRGPTERDSLGGVPLGDLPEGAR